MKQILLDDFVDRVKKRENEWVEEREKQKNKRESIILPCAYETRENGSICKLVD